MLILSYCLALKFVRDFVHNNKSIHHSIHDLHTRFKRSKSSIAFPLIFMFVVITYRDFHFVNVVVFLSEDAMLVSFLVVVFFLMLFPSLILMSFLVVFSSSMLLC